MKKIAFAVLFIFIGFNCLGQDNEKLIREAFSNYAKAILEDRGKDAVKYIHSKTLNYYNDISEWAKNADSVQIESFSLVDKLMVLSVRHRAEPKEILKMNGKQLFIFAVERGMIGKNGVMNTNIKQIEIKGNFAKVYFSANEQDSFINFHFYKEKKQWKIDLTSLLMSTNIVLKKILEQSGKTENEFLLYALEIASHRKPNNKIWHPINNK